MTRLFTASGGTFVLAASLCAVAIVAPFAMGSAGVPATYLRLGIEHILFGFDHLLFILALVILVRDWRRIAVTVTAFALAHSITLAAATLGLVTVRGPLVEIAIAFSIVLVAAEIVNARRGGSSLTARWPWASRSALAFCTGSVLPTPWPNLDCRRRRFRSRWCSSILVWRLGNWPSWLRFWRQANSSAAQ